MGKLRTPQIIGPCGENGSPAGHLDRGGWGYGRLPAERAGGGVVRSARGGPLFHADVSEGFDQVFVGEAILQAEAAAEEDSSLRRRHRVYRQLLLSPAVYREEMEEADFLYLLRFRHRLEEDFAEYLGFRLEIYRNTALLSAPEARARLTLFPDSRAICDIALQMGEETRRRLAAGEVKVEADGTIRLTPVEWEQWVGALKESRGAGWSKQYRTALVKQTAAELLALLKEWKMATVDPESGMIRLYPLLGRLAGEYPADFDPAGRDIKKEREGRS